MRVATNSISGSFRDPSGYLFRHEGLIHRRVNSSYRDHYELMMDSGFYQAAVREGLLISHQEVDTSNVPGHQDAYRVLLPEQIGFISYPYEWSFSQYKDAALLTLDLQKRALDFGLSLKDASAFNVQFHKGRPIFIDTLSFEKYPEGKPWVAYQQFCKQFLAPLALMAYRHPSLGKLLQTSVGGVDLELASKLLPWRTKLRLGLLVHLHLHARSQRVHGDRAKSVEAAKTGKVSKTGLIGIVEMLASSVRKLSWKPAGTEWGEYYDDTNYSDSAEEHKAQLVEQFIQQIQPEMLWDLGANTGRFSRIAARQNIFTVAADIDPAAVEKNYLQMRSQKETRIHPLLLDLTNPTPALGWGGDERMSLPQRGPADTAMALALIHHLAISNNVPLDRVAQYFRSLCRTLIIEFVPKSDSQVQRLLSSREDVFPDYRVEGFEAAFETCFRTLRREPIRDCERILYLLEAR